MARLQEVRAKYFLQRQPCTPKPVLRTFETSPYRRMHSCDEGMASPGNRSPGKVPFSQEYYFRTSKILDNRFTGQLRQVSAVKERLKTS